MGMMIKANYAKHAVALSLTLLLLGGAAYATPVLYRNPADGRTWQVVTDAAEPLVWQWAEGAVSATVTVSNVLSGAISETNVARGESRDGSYVLPQSVRRDARADGRLGDRVGADGPPEGGQRGDRLRGCER